MCFKMLLLKCIQNMITPHYLQAPTLVQTSHIISLNYINNFLTSFNTCILVILRTGGYTTAGMILLK